MNIGADRNFGQGILRSQGEFTWLLSDDDTVHEDAIDHIYESLYFHSYIFALNLV